MRAMVTMRHGGRECLEYHDAFPDPVAQPGQVVLRVAATALNYHDILTRRGMPGISIPLPVIVGSDIAGEIVELGAGVQEWTIGDRVLVDPVFRDGRPGMIGETVHGGRAQFVAVAASQLLRVPDSVSLEAAAALPLAYGTAYRMLVARGALVAGEKVLVLGASGGVGVACVQLAKLIGCEVAACASSGPKLDGLRALGADHCINYAEQDFVTVVREVYGKPRVGGGGGVDVAVNFTGGDTWQPTQRCVRLGGRILTCGATAGFDLAMDARFLWTYEHSYVGSNGWTPDDLRQLLDLVASGRLEPAIDRCFSLTEVAEAERILEDREVLGKLVIVP